ncbi:expressed unknown protein [Ectocarpus siliculosus]|uniref:Uncharacterized protein n=1 Tax=Ectocarpus siliculosus TaxID=2880 RepID=D7FU42_ECTSI|nr:expressed unknown protein [Ectocarpus siliculosus]|eukprot:CBJ31569.1 expressed unknown protein [Ectocarpus siliculosus]
MMERGQSLKRRRGWLLAGCSLLAAPVQAAAWPSWGTLWPALPPAPQSSRNQAAEPSRQNHHGTTDPAAAAAAAAAEKPPSLRGGRSSPSRQLRAGKVKKHRTIPLPSRVLEVAIAVQGRHGDWDACSPETCTQTRLVFCETLNSRIVVSNDLCGDELPSAERECTGADIDAACGGRDNSARGGPTQQQRSGGTNNGAGNTTPAENAGGSNEKKTGDTRSPVVSNSQKGKEAPSAVPGGGESAGGRTAASSKTGEDGGKEEGGEAGGPALKGSASGDDAADKSSRQQDETPAAASTNSSAHILAAKEQSPMSRMGGPGRDRAQYRFWLVMAIGGVAVGSFLAVVVFAVGQYRKERHRLRGIMALNEFPQDNYINPFAKQLSSDLSDEDRSAFKL